MDAPFRVGERVRRRPRQDGWLSLTQAGYVAAVGRQHEGAQGRVLVAFDTFARPSKVTLWHMWVPVQRLIRDEEDATMADEGEHDAPSRPGPELRRARIEHDFTYHPPKEGQPRRYERMRAAGKELALLIFDMTVPSREQSLALTKLEEAIMWANAAIARNE